MREGRCLHCLPFSEFRHRGFQRWPRPGLCVLLNGCAMLSCFAFQSYLLQPCYKTHDGVFAQYRIAVWSLGRSRDQMMKRNSLHASPRHPWHGGDGRDAPLNFMLLTCFPCLEQISTCRRHGCGYSVGRRLLVCPAQYTQIALLTAVRQFPHSGESIFTREPVAGQRLHVSRSVFHMLIKRIGK